MMNGIGGKGKICDKLRAIEDICPMSKASGSGRAALFCGLSAAGMRKTAVHPLTAGGKSTNIQIRGLNMAA